MQTPSDPRAAIRPLNLAPPLLSAYTAEIERVDKANLEKGQADAPSVPYRIDGGLEMKVTHPGGGIARFRVHPVNIAAGGISVVHGGYLHEGSSCALMLKPRDAGQMAEVAGKVAWCAHCSGVCHGVGIKFNAPIDLREFVNIERVSEALGKSQVANPEALTGRVIALEDGAIDSELLEVVLADTGVTFTAVNHVGAVMDILKSEPVDVLLCDLNLENMTGEEAIAKIRDSGYQGPIVAVTSVVDPVRLNSVVRVGAKEVLRKPFEPQVLLHVLGHVMSTIPIRVDNRPLKSMLDPALAAKRKVPSYVRRAKEAAEALTHAMNVEDINKARAACQSLRVSAEAYGYPLLGEASKLALAALDSSQSIAESRDALGRVPMVVERMVRAIHEPEPAMV